MTWPRSSLVSAWQKGYTHKTSYGHYPKNEARLLWPLTFVLKHPASWLSVLQVFVCVGEGPAAILSAGRLLGSEPVIPSRTRLPFAISQLKIRP